MAVEHTYASNAACKSCASCTKCASCAHTATKRGHASKTPPLRRRLPGDDLVDVVELGDCGRSVFGGAQVARVGDEWPTGNQQRMQ